MRRRPPRPTRLTHSFPTLRSSDLACFCIERTIDEIARAVGREPHKVRMENMMTPDLMPYRSVTSMLYDNGDYPQSVEKAVDLLDLPAVRERQARGEPDGRLIGIGFASYTEQTAHGCGEWITRGVPIDRKGT